MDTIAFMSRRLPVSLVFVLATCSLAWGEDAAPDCKAGDKECIQRVIVASPAKKIDFWRSSFDKPLAQRVGPAPPEIVRLLTLDNLYHGYPERPRVSIVKDDMRADVIAALEAIPEPVKRRLGDRLAGILFVDDFGGTGFTDSIIDDHGRKTKAFVVLDPGVLEKRTANAWATWKENTPFKPDGHHQLAATIEKPADDTRRQAIQYILLHELGHVLAAGGPFHPDWNLAISAIPDERYPFFDLSWSVDRRNNVYASRFDAELPERKSVVYYFGAKLDAASMATVYEHLERTNFPTLYSATHPGDDFAESFASYVHGVMMGKPFEIVISNDGHVVKRYGSCWNEERCAGKRRILEEFLR